MERMKKKERNLSWILYMILILVLLVAIDMSKAESSNDVLMNDIANKLKNIDFKVSTSDKIDVNSVTEIKFKADVPVMGDIGISEEQAIKNGDIAKIRLMKGITLKDVFSGTLNAEVELPKDDDSGEIENKTVQVASYKTMTEGEDTILNIFFDGDKKVFNEAKSSVEIEIVLELNTEKIIEKDVVEDKIFKIFDKEFVWDNITKPEIKEIKIEKTGKIKPESMSILWTINIENGNQLLDGFVFHDDLSTVGKYKENTFIVKKRK